MFAFINNEFYFIQFTFDIYLSFGKIFFLFKLNLLFVNFFIFHFFFILFQIDRALRPFVLILPLLYKYSIFIQINEPFKRPWVLSSNDIFISQFVIFFCVKQFQIVFEIIVLFNRQALLDKLQVLLDFFLAASDAGHRLRNFQVAKLAKDNFFV